MRSLVRRSWIILGSLALALVGSVAMHSVAFALPTSRVIVGAAYTEDNSTSGNHVYAYARMADGSLTKIGEYATGGNGIGGTVDPLKSQYAVALSEDHAWLFAVNAGSNTVTTFRVERSGGLRLVGDAPSYGIEPVSIAVHDETVYVLSHGDANQPGTIHGYRVSDDGLNSINGSVYTLSPNAGASSIAFSRDGRYLLVTELVANQLALFPVHDGIADPPTFTKSAAALPFGLSFGNHDVAVVSEVGLGATSYRIDASALTAVSTVNTNAKAPCWAIVTPNGKFAYVANAGSGTLSGYQLANNGTLTPLKQSSFSTGVGTLPIDDETSYDGRFLYTLNTGTGTIGIFSIGLDGALQALPSNATFPMANGFQGLATW